MNALLTQLDALRRHSNVMVLTTSNITEAIDLAFVDRADIKAYVGPPTLQARWVAGGGGEGPLPARPPLPPHPLLTSPPGMRSCAPAWGNSNRRAW